MNNRKKKQRQLFKASLLTALLAVMGLLLVKYTLPSENQGFTDLQVAKVAAAAPDPIVFMGITLQDLEVESAEISNGNTFGGLMTARGLNATDLATLLANADTVFDVRRIMVGRPHHFFVNDTGAAVHWIYEESQASYITFDLQSPFAVRRVVRPREVRVRSIIGQVESSLYESLVQADASPALAVNLANIYAWTIDFFRIHPGDVFKVVFEEIWVEDTVFVGIGNILASAFASGGQTFQAFRYTSPDSATGYYDAQGKMMKRAFLKAPLEFFRISSKFNPKRFHPVLKTMRAHLGTDYAAPAGTPIMTTADGVVEAAGYTSGNGNYVKVKHNTVYATQYLHMSKIAPGMKPGRRVKQGEVIGFVGSTGLATGPHVCYRFWKNGVQVNPLAEKLPESNPIDAKYLDDYLSFIQPLKAQLEALVLPDSQNANPQANVL
jgi:murein DD-endopeptidase MepM/ murein hydrolase activator NlpD